MSGTAPSDRHSSIPFRACLLAFAIARSRVQCSRRNRHPALRRRLRLPRPRHRSAPLPRRACTISSVTWGAMTRCGAGLRPLCRRRPTGSRWPISSRTRRSPPNCRHWKRAATPSRARGIWNWSTRTHGYVSVSARRTTPPRHWVASPERLNRSSRTSGARWRAGRSGRQRARELEAPAEIQRRTDAAGRELAAVGEQLRARRDQLVVAYDQGIELQSRLDAVRATIAGAAGANQR